MRYLLPFLLLWAMPVWAGGSRASDSTDDFIEISDTAAIDINDTGVSIGIWLKATANDDPSFIFWKGDNSSPDIRYYAAIRSTPDEIEFGIDDGTTKSTEDYSGGGTTATDGTWHFWEFIRNTTANELRIFEDGVHVAAPAATDSTGDVDNARSLFINDRYTSSREGNDITGSFAYFQLYKDVHAEDERLQAMHMPCSRPAQLELCMPLWGQDSPEEDLSVNQLTGTVTGMTEDQDAPPVFLHSPLVQKKYRELYRRSAISLGMPAVEEFIGVTLGFADPIRAFQRLFGGGGITAWCDRCLSFHALPSS